MNESLPPTCCTSPAGPAPVAPSSNDRCVDGTNANERERFPVAGPRYLDLHELGRGACGVVMESHDRQLDREVAVKRISTGLAADRRSRRRFLDEAKLTAALQHPGIVPVHEVGVGPDGMPFYAMKLLRGETLSRRIAVRRSLGDPGRVDPELLERFVDVCDAVAFAHRRSIIHRDLKPGNVMIGPCGETVVVDWGLAREVRPTRSAGFPEGEAATIAATGTAQADLGERAGGNRWGTGETEARGGDATRQGMVAGTPGYLSPEQARGDNGSLGPESDVFSLGVILFEIATGRSPYPPTEDLSELLRMTAEGRSITPGQADPRVPRPLASICGKAMAADPRDRYPTAEELAVDVRRFLADEPVAAHRDSVAERAGRWCRRNGRKATTMAVALVVITIVATVSAVVVRRAHQAEARAHAGERRAHAETHAALRAERRARIEADAARAEADAARAEAAHRSELARRAADRWIAGWGRHAEASPGLDHVHDRVLASAERTYQDLAARAIIDVRDWHDRVEHARCLTRIGDVRRMRNDPAAAARCYRDSLAALDEIRDPDPDVAVQVLVAALNNRVGLAEVDLSERHDADPDAGDATRSDVRDALREACQRVIEAAPERARVDLAVARGWHALARITLADGDLESSIETLARARGIAERGVRAGDNDEAGRELAEILASLSDAYQRSGQPEVAIRLRRRQVRLLQTEADRQGKRSGGTERIATARITLAELERETGSPAAAIRTLTGTIDELTAHRKRAWGGTFHHDTVAWATAELGRIAFAAGDDERGEASLRAAITQMETSLGNAKDGDVTDGDPNAGTSLPGTRERLAMAIGTLGRGTSVRDVTGGLGTLRRADVAFAKAADNDALSHAGYVEWAEIRTRIAELQRIQGDAEAAATELGRAEAILAAMDPTSIAPDADSADAATRVRWRIGFVRAWLLADAGDLRGASIVCERLATEFRASGRNEAAAFDTRGDPGRRVQAARLMLFFPDPGSRDPRWAEGQLRRAREVTPSLATDPDWWRLMAIAAMQLGESADAAWSIGRAIAVRGKPDPFDGLVASASRTSGDANDVSSEHVEDALRRRPGDAELRVWVRINGQGHDGVPRPSR